MLNHLGDGCFYLQDFEMDLVEIPYLIKFLQSKPVSVGDSFSFVPYAQYLTLSRELSPILTLHDSRGHSIS